MPEPQSARALESMPKRKTALGTGFEFPLALLHESVEVDRTLLPDAQAVISTL